MEPRIQYAQTADGVSIAYWTLGEGMPYVQMAMLFSHIQMEWQWSGWRSWYERLAQKRKLVRYDGRGAGLSERDVSDYSPSARLLDLEAVVDRLNLPEFVLHGAAAAGPVAIAYAARYPERVTHLVLQDTWARGSDYFLAPQVQAQYALIDKDWDFYAESMGRFVTEWHSGDRGGRYAAFIRECTTPGALRAAIEAASEFDAAALLPQVRSPTLVVHRRQVPYPSIDAARTLASLIPDARLALVEGTWFRGMAEALTVILEFLGEGEEAEERGEALAKEDIHTILFTDVEGSTALTQRLGDAKARAVLRQHERIVREALKSHGGSELKMLGDGFMASFSSATRALECAIAMQRAFAQHNESAEEPILVRAGLNAGEPIAEDEDLFGTAVIEAARIAAAAKGGEILVSDVVRQLAKGKDFAFADRGDVTLKGFEDPVRLFEVRWRE
jgi:class 3 adenylate cyclase